MKAPSPIVPIPTPLGRRRSWIGLLATPLTALLAAATPAKADHFYNAFTQEYDVSSIKGQEARAVATDSHGNVYVAGESINLDTVREWYIAKYDGLDGHLITSTKVGPNNAASGIALPAGDCVVRSMAIDSLDNVIVAGGAVLPHGIFPNIVNQEDYLTVKYNSNLGIVWARALDGSNNGQDEAAQVVIGPSNSVFVVGRTESSGQGTNYGILKYSSGGSLSFFRAFNSTGNIDDIPVGIAVYTDGSFYVTGYSKSNNGNVTRTLQYDSGGTLQHENDYPTSVNGIETVPAGIVVDSAGSAFITATSIDYNNSAAHSQFTAKYKLGIQFWSNNFSHSAGDGLAQATGISIGPDDNPVVTGKVDSGDNFGVSEAVVLKYSGAISNGNNPLWIALDQGLSPDNPNSAHHPEFDTAAEKVHVDGANNIVITGYTNFATDDNGGSKQIVYTAKFDSGGIKRYVGLYNGSSDIGGSGITGATGVDITTDAAGNIAVCSTEQRVIPPGNESNTGIHGIITQKYQRIIAETNDALPPNGNTEQKITALDAAAIADTGDLATKITFARGAKHLGAILTQGPEGGNTLAVVQGDPASVPGFGNANFASFGDPILSPDGHIAFSAKLGGVPGNRAASVWTDLNGTLQLALQQGSPLPGLTSVNVDSVMNIGLRNNQLLALVKVNGSSKSNTVLVSLGTNNIGTKLLRTNDPDGPINVGGTMSLIKSLTMFAPPPNEAGAGNWQADGVAVVKAVLADKRTVIFKATSNGVVTPILYTAQDASEVTSNATWKTFAYPAIGTAATSFAALGTISPGSKADDNAIVYSVNGGSFSLIAHEGDPVHGVAGLNFASLGNPLTNTSGLTGFLATIKAASGSNQKITKSNNRVVALGSSASVTLVAQSGTTAPQPPEDSDPTNFSSFSSLALPNGVNTPLFVAKISGKGVSSKSNTGVFSKDSTGAMRRLLRTGDKLGDQVVTSFSLLNASPQAFCATRSYNHVGGVVMLVHFKDHSTGILELQVP